MAQTPIFSTHSSLPLPDVFSTALTELFEAVRPGIVQIRVEPHGGGTGVIWSPDGRIITNNHVVSHAGEQGKIQVHLTDGRTLDAQVLHRNPQLDLALLKVTGDNLHDLSVGESAKLRVGEWVFAIGHPWGQRWAVTAGIVSTVTTIEVAGQPAQYIKSDVLLAPGNSGGPLLNADGNVVGINAMIFGGDLAVSIPSDTVVTWLASLPKGRRALGIEIQTVELPAVVRQSFKRDTGVLIVGTGVRDSYHHDLLIGDILLDVAGRPVADPAALRHIIADSGDDNSVSMKIFRGGSVVEIDIAIITTESSS